MVPRQDTSKTHTMRLSDEGYVLVGQLRQALALSGLRSLPEPFRSDPILRALLDRIVAGGPTLSNQDVLDLAVAFLAAMLGVTSAAALPTGDE